jgi:cysteinyl-tRNA synthetase
MSKSEGNVLTLTDVQSRDISPITFRYWLCTSHYRSPISFDPDTLHGAETALRRLAAHVSDLPADGTPAAEYTERIDAAIADDLDTPTVVATIWDAVNDQDLEPAAKRATIEYGLRLLGIDLAKLDERSLTIDELEPAVIDKLNAREQARTEKDFDRADRIRDELRSEHGFELEDTPDGPRVYPAAS